jgi:hypothetical protein
LNLLALNDMSNPLDWAWVQLSSSKTLGASLCLWGICKTNS